MRGTALSKQDDIETLKAVQRRVASNVPRHGNPEAFHIEKSEIVEAIKGVVKRMERRNERV